MPIKPMTKIAKARTIVLREDPKGTKPATIVSQIMKTAKISEAGARNYLYKIRNEKPAPKQRQRKAA